MVTLGKRVILAASSRPPQPTLENAAAQPRVGPPIDAVWTTDGTWSTTYADIVARGGRVFFSARTPEAGAELWQTDGDPADTGMVRDIKSCGSRSTEVFPSTSRFESASVLR